MFGFVYLFIFFRTKAKMSGKNVCFLTTNHGIYED